MVIEDIEYAIFRHPEPDAARRFMLDRGLLELGRRGGALYLRGYGDAPFCYVMTRGEAAFLGMGFRVADLDALEDLCDRFNSKIELSPRPGGGLRVVGGDPEGRCLEFVFGATRLDPVQLKGAERRDAFANGHGRFEDPGNGPAHVLRLGRAAILSPQPEKLMDWYGEALGLTPSGPVHTGNDTRSETSPPRLNQAGAWTEHHPLAIVRGGKSGLDRASFECRDSSDVLMGRDCWTDPSGFHIEHYVDSDFVPRETPIAKYPIGGDVLLQ
jgi:hypothetical protein